LKEDYSWIEILIFFFLKTTGYNNISSVPRKIHVLFGFVRLCANKRTTELTRARSFFCGKIRRNPFGKTPKHKGTKGIELLFDGT
jgi:hypothetical protein